MDDEKQDLEEQKGFLQLVKELSETQMTLSKINAQIIIKDGQEQVKDAVNKTRENIEGKAKALGVSAKKMEAMYEASKDEKAGILEEYEKALESVRELYDDGFLDIMETSYGLYQEEEQEIMLKQKETQIKLKQAKKELERLSKEKTKEIIQATKERKMDLAKEKIEELEHLSETHEANKLEETNVELQARREELRKMIEDAEKAMDEHKEARKEAIEKLTMDRDNKLAKVSKQNFFQKIAGNIFSKFNASKKFMSTAIEPLRQKIDYIKEETIPQTAEAMSNKKKEFSQKVQDDREKMEKVVRERINQHRERKAERKEQRKQFRKDAINKAIEMGQSVQDTGKRLKENVQDKTETAKIYGMLAKDKVRDGAKDKIETAAIYGMMAKDKVINGTKDKIETAEIYGMLAKDKGKRTYRGIIEKGHKVKLGLINRMQRKLYEKKKELEEKMQTVEEQKEDNENIQR